MWRKRYVIPFSHYEILLNGPEYDKQLLNLLPCICSKEFPKPNQHSRLSFREYI